MFLFDSIFSLFSLRWTQDPPKFRPLPPFINRQFVSTAGGNLELLTCAPAASGTIKSDSPEPAIFFVHGGYGSAGVWLEWMTYLHEHGYTGTLYAGSVRNHGASYSLPYFRMVFQTSFEDIQADVVACLAHATRLERERDSRARLPVLVCHSAGGGIAQQLLSGSSPDSTLRVQTSGLCLVGAIPVFGSFDIYWNWFKHDPWFIMRSIFHLQHPTSPLSTDQLVHTAFFGNKFPRVEARAFRRWMPAYESMGWPMGMVGLRFWSWIRGNPNEWLSASDITSNIVNAGDGGDQVCVLVGRQDMMYRPWIWQRLCQEYGLALIQSRHASRASAAEKSANQSRSYGSHSGPVTVRSEHGVRLVLVQNSGHHVQNDIHRDEAAEALFQWARQI